jgi:hypothetical protein
VWHVNDLRVRPVIEVRVRNLNEFRVRMQLNLGSEMYLKFGI